MSPSRLTLCIAAILFVFGVYVRCSAACAGVLGAGYDERVYAAYVDQLDQAGYPALVARYIAEEQTSVDKVVPPLRVTFIGAGAICKRLFGGDAFESLKRASCFFSIAGLGLVFAFGFRLGGPAAALAMLALAAVAPLQVQMAHRALVDGVFSSFALLALWLTWEMLHSPASNNKAAYGLGASIVLLVLTKETALLVWIALVVMAALAARLGYGTATRALVVALIAGPVLGVVALAAVCGGPHALQAVLTIDVTKPMSAYSVQHQDGNLLSLLIGLLVLNPLLTLLALGAVMAARVQDRPMIVYLLVTYACVNVPSYHKIVRLATMWDFPLAWLAWCQMRQLVHRHAALLLAVVCVTQFLSFRFFFQEQGVYDPALDVLLRCVRIVKN